MSDEVAFSFHQVSKTFGGCSALTEVSFEVPRGSVVGLVGRNGAGKSTAIRCLLGLQRPSAGQVRLLGHDPRRLPLAVKQRLGYMADTGLPFLRATAGRLFRFCAPLYPRWDRTLEQDLVGRLRIPPDAPLTALSIGQQRAVAFTLALSARPDVLVLDEPAANLDAVVRRELLAEVLGMVAEEGRTVLFSSHNLGDVERVADRIAFLREGRLLLYRSLEDLRERARRVRLRYAGEAPAELAQPLPGTLATRRSGREVLMTVDGFDEELVPELERQTGASVEVQPIGLEELFIDLAGPYAAPGSAA